MDYSKLAAMLETSFLTETDQALVDDHLAELTSSFESFVGKSMGSGFKARNIGDKYYAVIQVSVFRLSLIPFSGELELEISVTEPSAISVLSALNVRVESFEGDWLASYQHFKTKLLKVWEKSFRSSALEQESVVRKNGLKAYVSGFSGGAWGLSVGELSPKIVAVPSPLECSYLAESFEEQHGIAVRVTDVPGADMAPFYELVARKMLSVVVKEEIVNGKTLYQFTDDGVTRTFEVISYTMFGDDIRVDQLKDIDKGITFNQGVASYHTDVISAYINSKKYSTVAA